MSSIQALRERLAASNKAAKNLLAEKGSIPWTAEDQKTFDNHADESERITRQIDAHQKMIDADRDINFTDAADHDIEANAKNGKALTNEQKAFNVFLRKSRT